MVLISILLILVYINKFQNSNQNNFEGHKTIYVVSQYGIGGACSVYVYDKLEQLDKTCVSPDSISKMYLNQNIQRGIEDISSSSRAIYKVDADIHSTKEEIDTGNPASNSNTIYTMVHLDKVYSVELYST